MGQNSTWYSYFSNIWLKSWTFESSHTSTACLFLKDLLFWEMPWFLSFSYGTINENF